LALTNAASVDTFQKRRAACPRGLQHKRAADESDALVPQRNNVLNRFSYSLGIIDLDVTDQR
jgi:hypothetical protein